MKDLTQKEGVILTAIYNILFTNDIVCALIVDFAAAFRKSPLCCRERKHKLNQIDQLRRKYEIKISAIANRRIYFMADANQFMADELEPDLIKMELAIKQEFDRHCIENAGLLAKLETTRCMADLACKSLDKRIKEVAPIDKSVRGLTYLRLTGLFKLLDELSGDLYVGKYIDLNASQNCRNGIEIIQRKLTDCRLIADAIEKSEELNDAYADEN